MAEKLYNGIVLPNQWPPNDINLKTWQPMRVPYLENPPGEIPIDLGRQLLIDDFLIQETNMTRVFHQPVKYSCNPILFPHGPEECPADYPACSIAKCGGVWYDDRDNKFKMWYSAGFAGYMAYAESEDGICWVRPELDVVLGTNLCLPRELHPDSGTVWIDRDSENPKTRYKMLLREPNLWAMQRGGKRRPEDEKIIAPGMLLTSADGIHWSQPIETGLMGDRSTLFYNPFRRKWVHSIRGGCERGRSRQYWEHDDFLQSGRWEMGQPVPWTSADCYDQAGDSLPQLYTLDAVAYESVLLGLFEILKGPPNNICSKRAEPKLTELVLATSRDGFHWHRPDRYPFIGAHRIPGSWEFGYIEPSGGVCLIVGDEVWFYYSAYGGDPLRVDGTSGQNGMYSNGAVGLAKLRRDGFASMEAHFSGGMLLTRPLTFTGNHLFVNANMAGAELRAAIIGIDGTEIASLTFETCEPFAGNSTCAEIRWQESAALSSLRGQPVRILFQLDRGALYSFWISDDPNGASGGYLAAGGPGYNGTCDRANDMT
jgi:hypothetical protein